MVKWFAVIALLPAFAFGAPVKIQFWHSMSGPKGQLIHTIVEAFNKANADKYVVESQFIGTYEEGLNKLRTSLMAKRGPHVVQITDIGTQVMIDTNATVPLQTFLDKDPTFPAKEILPQIRRYYEVGGKLYSLPFATSNPILYYNVDAVKKAGVELPKTFAELETVAKKLTDKTTKTTGLTMPLHSWFFEQFLAIQGQLLVNAENGRKGRATEAFFTSPAAIEFVELWAKLVKDGTLANVGRGWDPAVSNFLAGRAAMLITSTSDVFEISKKATFKVMTAPLPTKDGKVVGGTMVGGNSLWILKDKPEAEQEGAYQLVKHMASMESQRTWHTGTGYFPIRADLIAALEKEGFYKKNPGAKTAIDQLRASLDVPATKGALIGAFSEVRVHVDSAIEKVLSGNADAKTALAAAKKQSDEAMARYNKGRQSE